MALSKGVGKPKHSIKQKTLGGKSFRVDPASSHDGCMDSKGMKKSKGKKG